VTSAPFDRLLAAAEVVITVLTSVTAFAAFIASRSPSLVYFGSQAAFALIGCLVVTLVVLPYLFRILLPPKDATIDAP
jgi:predicted RND superfamily exporter protein